MGGIVDVEAISLVSRQQNLSIWMSSFLILVAIAAGASGGVFLQRRNLLGRLRRQLLSVFRSTYNKVTTPEHQLVTLQVREVHHARKSHGINTESDGRHVNRVLRVRSSELALILIDVWADHPIKGHLKRVEGNTRTKLLPLVEAAREQSVLIVHCPHGEPMSPLVKPLANEPVLEGFGEQRELVGILRERKVKNLLYAGYASNMCILTRPVGIIEMSREGYQVVFVRDASLAVEAPDYLEGEFTHGVATYMVETNWGVSTQVDQVLAAFGRV